MTGSGATASLWTLGGAHALAPHVFKVPWGHYLGPLVRALVVTLELTAAGFIGATAIGLLVAVMRTTRGRVPRAIGYAYTEVIKNLPFVTGIFIIYFGLPVFGVKFGTFTAGVLCLAIFYGAYLGEIFRGGLQGVPAGQLEAGAALGLTYTQTFALVRLPQALRLALPATATMLVDLLKGTAILVTIGGAELMTEATLITSDTFRPFEVYLVIGGIYFVLCWPLSHLSAVLERSLRRGAALSWTSVRIRRAADRVVAERAAASATVRVG